MIKIVVTMDTTICGGVDACPEGGLCIDICALNAIDNVNGQPIINHEICPECGLCVLNCPKQAISKT